MKCVVCGTENPAENQRCSFCGKPLGHPSAAKAVSVLGSAVQMAPVQVPAGPITSGYGSAVAQTPAAGSSFAKKLVLGVVCGVVVVMLGLGTLVWIAINYVKDQRQYAPRLVREAMGRQPVRSSSGAQGKVDQVMRQMFHDIADLNRSYHEKISALDVSEMRKLYSAESFESAEEINKVLQQLDSILAVDSEQEQSMRGILDNARSQFLSSDLPESTRQEALDGFEKGIQKVAPVREQVAAAEKDWIDATEDLYRFALDNHTNVSTRDGTIMISDAGVRAQFSDKMKHSDALRQTFQQQQMAMKTRMAQFQQEIGLTGSDMQLLQNPH